MFSNLKQIYEIQHPGHSTLYSMEGLRGFAVFLVFLVHYMTLSQAWISKSDEYFFWTSRIHSLGNVGVDLFFVLSGYLIYGLLLKKERPFLGYIRRRIERIYPAFTTVFVIYLALSFLVPERSRIPNGTIDAIKYIAQNFLLLPGMFDIEAIITVAWSLSYEFCFYLVIPLLIFLLRLRRWSPAWRVAFFVTLGMVILVIPRLVGGHVRLAMFISGILVFEAATYFRPPKRLDVLGILGLTIGMLCTVAQGAIEFSGQLKFAVLAASFFFLCWACFAQAAYVSRAFQWSPIRWLGNMSYSYYLIHGLVLNAVFFGLSRVFAPSGDNFYLFWTVLPLSFLMTFVVSTLLFIWVEKPLSLSRTR